MEVRSIISNHLGVQIVHQDFERIIPVKRYIKGSERKGAKVTFMTLKKRREVYKARTKLGDTDLWISDDLTKINLEIAKEAYKAVKGKRLFKSWYFEGAVFLKTTEKAKPVRIVRRSLLDNILRLNDASDSLEV